MKRMIMMMALAAGLACFAAANDPLISTSVEKGATYDVLCRGERVFSFVSNKTGKVNVQGVANQSVDPNDYSVIRTTTALPVLQTVEIESVEMANLGSCFNLEGPDHYADGQQVLSGEAYALVLMKPGTTFKGFVNHPDGYIGCVDAENNWFHSIFGWATDAGPHCVPVIENLQTLPAEYEGGTFAVYLLDTRKPGTNELTDRYNGLPLFVQAYHELPPAGQPPIAANGDWTKVLLSSDGQRFNFDPSLALNEGFAAVYSKENGEDIWTVRAMPQAWAEKQKVNTVFETADDLYVLRGPETPLTFPCSNDVDYIFNAAKTPEMRALIAKVVANSALLRAIVSGQPISPEMLAGFTQDELILLNGELSAWAQAVLPFFQWNADFEVSFNRFVEKGTVFLSGQYDGAAKWNFTTWVGAVFADDMKAGDKIRLLRDAYQEVYLNYSEICTNVIQFKCGAMNLSPKNWGTTMSVNLRLYENSGRCNETKSSFSVGVYKYTFQGPLNIKYYVNGELFDSVVTNHDGLTQFPLISYQTKDPELAFTGWTNKFGEVVSAIPTLVHEATADTKYVKTWYKGGDDTLELFAAFKPAKTATVTVVDPSAQTAAQTSTFKVTEDFLKEKGIENPEEATVEEIKEVLEAKEGEANRPAWQNYLLGMDPDAELKIEKTNGNEDDKALVVSTVNVVAPDTGIRVGYSLDKVGENESSVEKEGQEQETKDLKIDLDPKDDTPTGYYKMNVIFTPTTNEGGQETEGEKVKIPADNTIGVLRVASDEKLVPIAVPWNSLDSGDEISAAEIVKTSTLSNEDKLHVYDSAAGAYHNYELRDGAWSWVNSYQLDANGVVTETPAQKPEEDKIARGSGVWLERSNTEKPFYLIGQYKSEDPATSVVKAPAPGQERPEYNLIAPTGIEPETDLNEVKALRESADVEAGDQIVIIRNGLPTRYEKGESGKWGYRKQVYEVSGNRIISKKVTEENDAKVPAGTGIWYISAGGNPTIDWGKKVGE